MTTAELASTPDYTAADLFNTVYVVVATDKAGALHGVDQVDGAHPHIEARFWRQDDADRYARSMTRTMPWKHHRVYAVTDEGEAA